ncbi:MAG TPA: hypothetical protein VNW71_10220 [Thermoanaerobaculia bacterium]|nr:hypothetical protein [Thermoanaerobaculia bacterium]
MVDRKTSKGGGEAKSPLPPMPATPPPGWQLSDERLLTRKLWFPSSQVQSLYVVYLLALAARMRVGVTLASSGCCLSVMLMEPSKPRPEASRKLFNFAVRLG